MEIHLRTTGCRLPYDHTMSLATRQKRKHLALSYPSQPPVSEGWLRFKA